MTNWVKKKKMLVVLPINLFSDLIMFKILRLVLITILITYFYVNMYRQLFSLVTCHPIIVSPHLLIKIFIKTTQQKEKKIKILVKLTGCRRFFFIIWSNSWLILLYFSSVLGVNTNCCKTKKDKGSQVIPKYRNCNLNSFRLSIQFNKIYIL